MPNFQKAVWSKSYCHVPRDNINPNDSTKSKAFVASYLNDDDSNPPAMNLVLGWEFGRIWLEEREAFVAKRVSMMKPKIIRNDYKKWIEKRKGRPNAGKQTNK